MWKYYRNGKLVKECNDLPETVEDAVIELQENGYDVSNCVIDDREEPCDDTKVCNTYNDTGDCNCDDFWSPDYPPEEGEYKDTLTFKPLNDDELINYGKIIQQLKDNMPKLSDDFNDKLLAKIDSLKGVKVKQTRFERLSNWWSTVTTGEKVYLSFWLIFFYILAGMIIQDKEMLRSFIEVILWPFSYLG